MPARNRPGNTCDTCSEAPLDLPTDFHGLSMRSHGAGGVACRPLMHGYLCCAEHTLGQGTIHADHIGTAGQACLCPMPSVAGAPLPLLQPLCCASGVVRLPGTRVHGELHCGRVDEGFRLESTRCSGLPCD